MWAETEVMSKLMFEPLAAPSVPMPKLSDDEKRAKARKFVDDINQHNNGHWLAEYNERFALMEDAQKKQLAGSRLRSGEVPVPLGMTPMQTNGTGMDMGKRRRKRAVSCSNSVGFDVRSQWPGCAAIVNNVRDQSQCGSCWAVSTGSVYTDRHCIAKAKIGQCTDPTKASSFFSEADILSCSPNSNGCNGGSPYYAWQWIRSTGLVTGTNFTTNGGCKPYPFPPNSYTSYSAPACSSACASNGWSTAYGSDKHFGVFFSEFF